MDDDSGQGQLLLVREPEIVDHIIRTAFPDRFGPRVPSGRLAGALVSEDVLSILVELVVPKTDGNALTRLHKRPVVAKARVGGRGFALIVLGPFAHIEARVGENIHGQKALGGL